MAALQRLATVSWASRAGLDNSSPDDIKKTSQTALKPSGRRHSPPPTKPFPASVYSRNRDSGASVSSYWSRSSRSSISSSTYDSRSSTFSFQSERTSSFDLCGPTFVPSTCHSLPGGAKWRSPGEIVRRYDEMISAAQNPPDISPNPTCTVVLASEEIQAAELGLPKTPTSSRLLCVSFEGAFPICRRLDDDMINGTQLLYALGRGKCEVEWVNRTLRAERQKQIVISHRFSIMQGIWIPFERALGYANKTSTVERLYPLFVIGWASEYLAEKPHQQKLADTSDKSAEVTTKQVWSDEEETLVVRDELGPYHVDAADNMSSDMAEMSLKETLAGVDEDNVSMPSIADVLAIADGAETGALIDTRPLSTATSSMSQTASEEGTISDEGTVPTTLELKAMLLTRLMDYFFSVFSTTTPGQPQSLQKGALSSAANTRPSSGVGLGGSLTSTTSRSSMNKRRRISLDDGDRGGGEDGAPSMEPKDVNPDEDSVAPKRRLACPYFKNNPRKFQQERSCCGPGWRTVHRMNEHLYRNHRMPLYCLRCHQVFGSSLELEEHSRRPDPTQCELSPNLPDFLQGRLNSDQEKLLRSRRKQPKDMTEEKKWVGVYRILFPAEDPAAIPSPYYEIPDTELLSSEDSAGRDTSELERYESFLRRELPESLRGQLVDIVRDLQLNLFEVYIASRGSGNSASDPNLGTGAQEEGGQLNEDTSEYVIVANGIDTEVSGNDWSDQGTEYHGSMPFGPLDDELAAYRPVEPYAEESLGDFNGLLFNFPVEPWTGSGAYDFMTDIEGTGDSGYGGSNTDGFAHFKEL
ncbi:hypothetical protein V8F20_006247 [Naviculisporaceae sp. PSN 640]